MEYAWRIFGSIDTQRRGGYASVEIAGDGEVSEKNGMPRYADPVSLSEPFANPLASFVGSFFIADTLVLPPPPNNYNSRGRNPGSNAFASPSLTVIQSTRRNGCLTLTPRLICCPSLSGQTRINCCLRSDEAKARCFLVG